MSKKVSSYLNSEGISCTFFALLHLTWFLAHAHFQLPLQDFWPLVCSFNLVFLEAIEAHVRRGIKKSGQDSTENSLEMKEM